MNAVEIEKAVSDLAEAPFDAEAFCYDFLAAFGNKETTLKRLRAAGKSSTNKTDLNRPGVVAVLQRNNIHLATCPEGDVADTLQALLDSPATAKQKAKFAIATDGRVLHAQNLADDSEPPLVCDFAKLGDHFGYFLALAGISTVRQIRENAFDIKATGRLNRLYVELLKHNEEWSTDARREDLNHFFARLIFCFFAEDTGIFHGDGLFTDTLQQMTEPDGSNTHAVLAEIFRAMDVPATPVDRAAANLRPWANAFPYVNGGLFASQTPHDGPIAESHDAAEPLHNSVRPSHTRATPLDKRAEPLRKRAEVSRERARPSHSSTEASHTSAEPSHAPADIPHNDAKVSHDVPTFDTVPRFTRTARSYLLYVGSLDWTKINPDIFGSMIQAVADDKERGALGMHYTSVPNILKVLNPLFLDDLRDKLDTAGDRPQALRHLRKRLARIRVFDPACGSGNFLVIAYKQMRQIEATINERLGEPDRPSDIPLTNFRGIEIRHFAAEIARLALVIAEYQCDVLHRGQTLAMAEFLPLDETNWITRGNALRLDWLSICPPTGVETDIVSEHMFEPTQKQARIDFQNEGGETYICGNPPYAGTRNQTDEQKDDLKSVLAAKIKKWRSLDYVAGWLVKAEQFLQLTSGGVAFVTTNSICQGLQVPVLWEHLFRKQLTITFAHAPFKWKNLAAQNAGVSVVIVGLRRGSTGSATIYTSDETGEPAARAVQRINAYLVPADDVFVLSSRRPKAIDTALERGVAPVDDGQFLLEPASRRMFVGDHPDAESLLHQAIGGEDFIRGRRRSLIRVDDPDQLTKEQRDAVEQRAYAVANFRRKSRKAATRKLAEEPFRFGEEGASGHHRKVFVPNLHSERRDYLTAGLLPPDGLALAPNFATTSDDLVPLALLSSRLHLVWVATVCGKLKTDYRYSNTLGWNTFPVPALSEQNRADLTRRAEDILLAREAHWPATIADLYDPDRMPDDLRRAHDANDETLERIYVGRRFKNDTERLEHLFDRYTKMAANEQ